MDPRSERFRRLAQLFHEHISGERQVGGPQDAKLFLEAADVLCKQKSPSACVEAIVSSPKGVEVVRTTVRSGLSTDSVKTALGLFISHLLSPQVKALGGGQFLQHMLLAILSPPTFWNALREAHSSHAIQDEHLETFAKLCLEIATSQHPDLQVQANHVEELINGKSLMEASSHPVRVIAYRIQKVIQLRSSALPVDLDGGPGGRHDNDFADFRHIRIYPTADEIRSTEEPFLQRLDDVFKGPKKSARDHRGWVYRLLREDMLGELREDLLAALGHKKTRRTHRSLQDLALAEADPDDFRSAEPFTLTIKCGHGVTFPWQESTRQDRKNFLFDNRSFMKHLSFGALCSGIDVVAFGSLLRDVDLLSDSPPVLVVRFTDAAGLRHAVEALLGTKRQQLKFVVVDTPTFAYEPILQRLKELAHVPIVDLLLDPTEAASNEYEPPTQLANVLESLEAASLGSKEVDLSSLLALTKPIRVRGAQLESLINGLKSTIGQIQGPPGTGKSFVGALIVLLILKLTGHRVLVLSHTNHALDQFLADLMDIGIDKGDMVRLGSKPSAQTQMLALADCMRQREFRSAPAVWFALKRRKVEASDMREKLAAMQYKLNKPTLYHEILTMLEFSKTDSAFWMAFQIQEAKNGFRTVGRECQHFDPVDLYQTWRRGRNLDSLGALRHSIAPEALFAWNMPYQARCQLHDKWTSQARQDLVEHFVHLAEENCQLQHQIESLGDESKRNVLRSKRVIGCTTTAAAMYQSIIKAAEPDVVLVEEAGEILEAHVIAALGPSVKQLCLIGDHKQLRPKVNNYKLTVERGHGYDLNVSLFERLIRQGHSYTALQQQHRSHPDISHLTRLLAYEKLEDGPKTLSRPKVRGLQKRVIFVHHENREDPLPSIQDRREPGSKTSKTNVFEADMVLKTVKYLGQQGYGSQNLVILVPYLGQLSLLRSKLSKSHDPCLNDLDQAELIRAGLMAPAVASVSKTPLRLSTIDNYQGEESDIVIVSLTRSNPEGDIGFMSSRERLVVLVSRAREGIVLFGNMHTFMRSKKGGGLWREFIEALKDKECLFDGVPVHCERHPERTVLLKTPEDFDQHCPDGGCAAICDAKFSCGKHTCSRRCHRVQDHSKISCPNSVERTCDRGHHTSVPCGRSSEGCKTCAREDADTLRRAKRDLDLERKRQTSQDEYRLELQRVEDEIHLHQRKRKYEAEEDEQGKTLSHKRALLRSLKETSERISAAKEKCSHQVPAVESAAVDENQVDESASPANQEWKDMKVQEGTCNHALDDLMELIGLDSVKDEFLAVKSSIDTKIRQGVSLTEERFSCALLGNPGTGKTTVARLWGRFLTSVGAVPGEVFQETTGAKLANDGVSAAEKMLEEIKDNGGGVLFIDEAYQLSSGNSPGGKAVMDYLLAEVENLRGKVIFVLAGYRKQMESFFAHNPGLPSRFPSKMVFEDYDDAQLLKIFQRQIKRKWGGRVVVEGEVDGLFPRIAARRVGRGRGTEGFGNARAVENALAKIEKRQARRLRLERRAGRSPNDTFTKEDIIGPEPAATLERCGAWKRLNDMVGLGKVKEEVKILLDSLTTNYQRELAEEPLIQFALNRVFLGSPGTGKTTVAKLYGQVLADLGLLSDGEVVVKTPADFVGAALGQSEAQTKGILAATVGKVLVIDEAYGLYGGRDGPGSVTDPYRVAVVDTIVAEVQGVPGEDRCVILLGYQEQMQNMFQHVNPGLSRRFAIDSPFVFEDFNDEELGRILDLKLKDSGFNTTGQGRRVAVEVLGRERSRPNFGNGGAVDNLLSKAKASFQKRSSHGNARRNMLEPADFDEEYNRAERTDTNVAMLFKGEVGRDKVVAFLEELQKRVKQLRSIDLDPKEEIPFNFLFRGPPGTGKTTTARKMGKVYYDMGILAEAKVIECSATDLIGQYTGQTGPKVKQMLDRALGCILFIDEAYRLAEGHFAKEAVDELVDSMTKSKYQGKMIIILAGYVDDINRLLSTNPGMSSRFPEAIDFDILEAQDCVKLLTSLLSQKKADLQQKGRDLDMACLEAPSDAFKADIVNRFQALARVKGWGNARDVKQLARCAFRRIDLMSSAIRLEEEHVRTELDKMLNDRMARQGATTASAPAMDEEHVRAELDKMLNDRMARQGATTASAPAMDAAPEEGTKKGTDAQDTCPHRPVRDGGVSDQVWHQLQLDRAEAGRKETRYQKLKMAQKSATDAARERIIGELLEEDERRKQEAAVKARLKAVGVCPAGYEWIKQEGGYRCAGGSHWMSDGDLKKMK